MNYGEKFAFTCIVLLNEKNKLVTQLDNINHQLDSIYNHTPVDLPSDMNIILYNKETTLKSQAQQIQDQIKKIDTDFSSIIKGLLISFSKTNIINKDLIFQAIYDTI